MTYGWLITTDFHPDANSKPGTNYNAKGVMGPNGITDQSAARLLNGEGHLFRLYDDDHILYYEGRFIGDHDSEDGFGPLDDFGMPNAGCTSIEYYRNGGWEQL